MEAVYYAVRANLRRLMGMHPQWTQSQYAHAVGMSVGWVKKWKKRLQEAEPEDEQVLHSRSRARVHPPERISQRVVDPSSRCAKNRQRACDAHLGLKRSCSICRAMSNWRENVFRAQAARSTGSCRTQDASPIDRRGCTNRRSVLRPCVSGNSISRMHRPSRQNTAASGNMG